MTWLKTESGARLWIFPLLILLLAISAWLFADGFFAFVSASLLQFKNLFWAIAFGWSAFLALYAFQLHTRFHADNPDDVLKGYGKLRGSQIIHQLALNFLGGMVGWAIIYVFLYTDHLASFEGWEKIVLLFIAFMGITGYLPYTLIIKSWLPR